MEGFDELVSVWGPNPHCERGFAFQINSNEDGSKLVYGSEKNLVMRDYENPSNCTVYTDHRGEVTLAKFSHKGDYLASADSNGVIHLLKVKGDTLEFEKQLTGIAGKVFDLCWYPNDKGLAAAGDSQGINGRAFTLSGTDQGQINAPKRMTSIDMSPSGNITNAKLMTGCDDNRARSYYYKGGFKNAEKDVAFDMPSSMVRFAPSGEVVATVGGKDIKLVTADDNFTVSAHIADAHKGTIYAVSWSPDSSHFITCSSDKTVKLWDANTQKAITTFNMKGVSKYKRDLMDFQVGCCFAGPKMVSLSLSGDINYLDEASGKVGNVIAGPGGSLVSADVTSDGSLASISTAGEILFYSPEGRVKRSQGLDEPKKGVGCVKTSSGLFSCSFDDYVNETKLPEVTLTSSKFGLGKQPVYMSRSRASNDLFVVATTTDVFIMKDAKKPVCSVKLPANTIATCAALSPNGTELAVGTTGKEVIFYTVNGGSATLGTKKFGKFEFEPASMSYCESTGKLAVGLATKFVKVMTADGKDFAGDNWCRHSSTVWDVSFSPNGARLISCGTEGNIVVWDANDGENFMPLKQLKLAHKSGVIACKWVDDNTFYSVGRFDGTVKKWQV